MLDGTGLLHLLSRLLSGSRGETKGQNGVDTVGGWMDGWLDRWNG